MSMVQVPDAVRSAAREKGAEVGNFAAFDVADGDGEVRSAAVSPSDGRGFNEVDTRVHGAFDACIKACTSVVVVRDAAAVLGHQVEV